MALSQAEREGLIRRYAEGPARLKAALATVPAEALQRRPKPGEWSAHEVVVHCADSETNGAGRIRYLAAERIPSSRATTKRSGRVASTIISSPWSPPLPSWKR